MPQLHLTQELIKQGKLLMPKQVHATKQDAVSSQPPGSSDQSVELVSCSEAYKTLKPQKVVISCNPSLEGVVGL